MPAFEIVTVKTGEKSLRCLERQETFHPGIGPQAEARILHVEQQRIVERAKALTAGGETFILWDVGLGAGANAIAALNAWRAAGPGLRAEIHSFDISLAPLEFALSREDALTYIAPYRGIIQKLLREGSAEVAPGIRWFFHGGDFRQTMSTANAPSPHGIFYDPYSPGTNREMWTLDHFTKFRALLPPGCLLTNYSRSTSVRITWLLAGFYVGYGDAIHEKDQTTVAGTSPELILRPIGADWLPRVKISRNAAPIRGEARGDVPIAPEDFARLLGHPQFKAWHESR